MKQTVRIYDFDYSAGDSAGCPRCGRRHLCRPHRYVYRKWYRNYRARMIGFTSGDLERFSAEQWENPDP